MTSRVSLYDEVHKGPRRQLFTLLLDCGDRDPEDEVEVSTLLGPFRELQPFVTEHAAHEDPWVEPILDDLEWSTSREQVGL